MRRHVMVGLCVLALTALVAANNWRDTGPDDDGYIRNWVVLAPIPLGDGTDGEAGLDKVGITDEGKISPKPDDKTTVGGKEYTWRKYQAKESHLDFNDFLGGQSDDCVAYAVTYVVCDKEVKNLKLKMGSDDQAKVYLNGKEVVRFTTPRSLTKDEDTVENITLNKGKNTIVFKVVNEKIDFSGSIRFLEGDDKPFKGFKVALEPK